jgi:AraC-like DNA-binding protein
MLYRVRGDLFLNDLGRNMQIVQSIRRTMEERYGEKITLADLSSAHHVSLSHLTHVFKNTMGYAPIEYLIECRLSAAKQLLSSTDLPIAEIVEKCGFSDESNFSRTFKKKVGMTPTEFRKIT